MSSLRTTLLAGIVSLAATTSAFAGSYSVTTAYGPNTTDFLSPLLSIAAFDTTLGTLTGVQVTLAASGNVAGTIKNVSGSAATFNVTETTTLNTTANGVYGGTTATPGLDAIFVSLVSTQNYANLADQATADFGPYTPANSTVVNPTDFADFENGPMLFYVGTLTSFLVSGGGANATSTISTVAGGSVSIQYTYTTPEIPTIPEPASIALLGAGMVGFGLIRRKKA
jgi:hypothetical protein